MNNGCKVDPKWAPRPDGRYNSAMRHDYHAGYSDGFYVYRFGASHAEPNAAYRSGYAHGRVDAHRYSA